MDIEKARGMEVPLGKGWRITSDGNLNFMLERLTMRERERDSAEGKAGEKYQFWVNEGFYGNFGHALDAYANHRLLRSDAKSLSELRTVMEEIRADVQAVKEALCVSR